MSMAKPFRWLHLSDFHVGKDDLGENELFGELVDHVVDKCADGFVPHIVLITGDLAQAGKSSEYKEFQKKLFDPLNSKLEAYRDHGWPGQIYAVPGNHDVDRNADYATRDQILDQAPQFFRPTTQGLEDR